MKNTHIPLVLESMIENNSAIDTSIMEKLSPLLLFTVMLCRLFLVVSAAHRLLFAMKFLLL